MLAAEAPWAPIVAFMVASPLTSPSELLLSAGLFGWGFARLCANGRERSVLLRKAAAMG
jgi:uncharacterized membrane protein YraQ (UPF0718 family)